MDSLTAQRRSGESASRRTFLKGTGAVLGALGTGGSAAAGGTDTDAGDGSESERDTDEVDGSNDPLTIAHRGFAGPYPENTIAAMHGAAAAGADAIEIDLMPCADGTPVVFHDVKLSSRTDGGLTDESGVTWETDCETILGAEVLESGESIPTFEEVMEAIPSEVGVTLEMKNPGTSDIRPNENLSDDALETQRELWRPFTERVLDIADGYDNDVMVAASREGAIAAAKEVAPDMPTAFFFSDSIEVGLDIARTYDCEALWPPINMVKRSPFWESPDYFVEEPDFEEVDLVEIAHEAGRQIFVFTLNTGYEADQMRMADVDGILSNYPGLYGFGRVESEYDGSAFGFDR